MLHKGFNELNDLLLLAAPIGEISRIFLESAFATSRNFL
jgi:hypothetical protein